MSGKQAEGCGRRPTPGFSGRALGPREALGVRHGVTQGRASVLTVAFSRVSQGHALCTVVGNWLE